MISESEFERTAFTKAPSNARKRPTSIALNSAGLDARNLELIRLLRERDLAEARAYFAPSLTTAAIGVAMTSLASAAAEPIAIGCGIVLTILGAMGSGYAQFQAAVISRQLDQVDELRTRDQ